MDGNAQYYELQQKETVRDSAVSDCFKRVRLRKSRLWLRALKIFISQEVLNSLPTSISSRTVLLAGIKNLKKHGFLELQNELQFKFTIIPAV
jgi:hypothetical protein